MNESHTEPYATDIAVADEPVPVDARRIARQQRRRERTMLALLVLLAVLAIAAVVSILWQPRPRSAQAPSAAPAARPVAAAPGAQAARYPILVEAGEQPPLDMSDATILATLGSVFGDGSFGAYVERDRLVRRIVTTIDNLPRKSAPPAQWPVKPAAGTMATTTTDSGLAIADSNALRYSPYVRLLESVNLARFVDFYRRHYPLFQQAYRELGYPDGHFNDRAVEAIDVMMATPTFDRPPKVAQPKVFVQYADGDLEKLPAGQKVLLRLGQENAVRVKSKLAEIREAITEAGTVASR